MAIGDRERTALDPRGDYPQVVPGDAKTRPVIRGDTSARIMVPTDLNLQKRDHGEAEKTIVARLPEASKRMLGIG